MPVTIQLENPCLTAVLDGEIDHHCARSLREEIDQAILDYEPHQLRLDFEKVKALSRLTHQKLVEVTLGEME